MAHGKRLILRVLGLAPRTIAIPTTLEQHVCERNRVYQESKPATPPIDLPERISRAWEHEEGEKIEMVL